MSFPFISRSFRGKRKVSVKKLTVAQHWAWVRQYKYTAFDLILHTRRAFYCILSTRRARLSVLYFVFPSMQHSRGNFVMFWALYCVLSSGGHFIVSCPLEGHPRGNVTTFCLMKGHLSIRRVPSTGGSSKTFEIRFDIRAPVCSKFFIPETWSSF